MLEFRNLSKSFTTDGQYHSVLSNLSLSINEGEFVAIAGPSGCGKSTLIRLTAGLDHPDSGEILAQNGAERLGYVFQEAALLPWRTLTDNVAIGLETKGVSKADRTAEAATLLRTFGLGGFENYYPHMVSGGMKARAAIARAYIINPTLLLMDEPFAALDAQTREKLQGELSRHWQQSKRTVLFVTHSLEEALLLGTRVVVLGRPPLTIVADYPIPFDFPRDSSAREFVALKQKLREKLQ